MTSITLSLVFLPMIKTNTKKKSSPKKTPAVAAKAPVAKKVAPAKKAPAKSVSPKKTTSPKKVTPTKAPIKTTTSVKKAAPATVKKIAPKKIASPSPASQTKTDSHTETKSVVTSTPKEGVKILGVLHLVGNILSGGALGIILVIIYYFFQHEKLSRVEKETCFEIINFNLSFILYMGVAVGLVFAIIGIVLIPVVWITWFVLLIL